MRPESLLFTSSILSYAYASGFPPVPEGIITKQLEQGVSLSYKETHICESKARAFAGYVHMPSTYLGDIEGTDPYNISMFFWYFQARNNPENAPTSLYLSGGPGDSSLNGAAEDGGPCTVLPDSNSTAENPWSWNHTLDLLFSGSDDPTDTGIVPFAEYNGSIPEANTTFLYGTFPSQSFGHTANSSLVAARTLWHFCQVWFEEFPEYKTCDKRISIWGNSYGGYWTTTSGAYFQSQNVRIKNGELYGTILPLDTIGMTNGCLDELYQGYFYPSMAYNNTYDLEVIPKDVYEEATNNFTKPGGCRDLIISCRELGDQYDPDQLSISAEVNEACLEAELYCAEYVLGAYDALSNRSDFDMASFKPDPFPPSYLIGFFTQHWVQQELGVPVNFTDDSFLVNNVFIEVTGDAVRTPGMKHVEYLLDQGVKVTFVYGDRDYRCPWLGVESLSLQANWTRAEAFRAAGYEFIDTNSTYQGGMVRQHGNLSFSRVFESGHDVQAFQPETAYRIFNRAMFNTDIASGRLPTNGPLVNYSTHGPSSSFQVKNQLPPPPETSCYLWDVGSTCTIDQFEALANGTAVIVDYTVVSPPSGGGPLSVDSGL